MNTKFRTVDEYISTFPAETQKLLEQVRAAIRQAAPDAEETIGTNRPYREVQVKRKYRKTTVSP